MTAEAVEKARQRLVEAHAARAEAQRVLADAKDAASRARQFAVAARDRCAAGRKRRAISPSMFRSPSGTRSLRAGPRCSSPRRR